MKTQFKIHQQTAHLRCGQLMTSHGVINTPAVIPYTKNGTVSPLTPREIGEIGCQGMAVDLLPLLIQPGERVIADAGSLHTFLQWPRPLMALMGDLPEMAKVKKNAVELGARYEEPYTKAKKRLNGQAGWQSQEVGQADVMFPLFQNANYYAPVDDLKLATTINLAWQTQSKSEWGVVTGAGLRELRHRCVQELGPKVGYLITNLPADPVEWQRIVRTTMTLLPAQATRVLIADNEWQIVRGIELGVDIVLTAVPIERAHRGDAFVRKQLLHLAHENYQNDQRQLDLPDGETVTFAYLHYLNHLQNQVGDHLLGLNNLHWMNQFTNDIRDGISKSGESWVINQCEEYLNNFRRDN